MSLDPESVKLQLSLAPLADENGDPPELSSLSIFQPGILEKLAGNHTSTGQVTHSESLTYDWRIRKEHVNDWIAVTTNLINAPKLLHMKNFNEYIGSVPELSVSSPKFQAGSLIGRCTNWHLELRIVEHGDGDVEVSDGDDDLDIVRNKYLGVFLIMYEPIDWGNDELIPEYLHAAVNIQLRKYSHDLNLQSSSSPVLLVHSARTGLLKFGFDLTCIQFTCVPDFILWDEFQRLLVSNCTDEYLALRLRMDMLGGTSWLRKKRSRLVSTSDQVDDEADGETIIISGSLLSADIEMKMKHVLASGDGADVIIYTVDNQVLMAHREILISRAPGLAFFTNDHNELHVNFSQPAMKMLLEYIYTGQMKFPKPKPPNIHLVHEILAAGAVFAIRDLTNDVIESVANSLGFGIDIVDDKVDETSVNRVNPRQKEIKFVAEEETHETDLAEDHSGTTNKHKAIDENFIQAIKELNQKTTEERLNMKHEMVTFFEKRNEEMNFKTVILGITTDTKSKVKRVAKVFNKDPRQNAPRNSVSNLPKHRSLQKLARTNDRLGANKYCSTDIPKNSKSGVEKSSNYVVVASKPQPLKPVGIIGRQAWK